MNDFSFTDAVFVQLFPHMLLAEMRRERKEGESSIDVVCRAAGNAWGAANIALTMREKKLVELEGQDGDEIEDSDAL